MTTNLENKIMKEVCSYYCSDDKKPVGTKSRFVVINDIHQKLGWGNLSNSFFAFICDLCGLMTPKAAKITKALRVFKVETYKDLSEKIHEKYRDVLLNPSGDKIKNLKEAMLDYAITEFPQFSKEEIKYIIDNINECDDNIKKIETSDFKTKNIAWKVISTAANKKAQVEQNKFSPSYKFTDEGILASIKDYYENDYASNPSEVKDYRMNTINQIHKKLGLGDLTKSYFYKFCDLFLATLTPNAAKINKALRVYKVDTFPALLEKLREVYPSSLELSGKSQEEQTKTLISKAVKDFPQFSKFEVEYILANLEKCKEIIACSKNCDFNAKNNAWKKITIPMRQKLQHDYEAKFNKKSMGSPIDLNKTDIPFDEDDQVEIVFQENSNNDLIDQNAFDGVIQTFNIEQPQVVGHTCKANVNQDVGLGKELGICISSDWTTPKLFNYEDNQWKGNIPHGKEFKFVIVQNGQIIAWEKSENRILTKQEGEIYLAQGELKF